jgi:hypothetical protein
MSASLPPPGIFRFIAPAFVAGGIFHLVGFIRPDLVEPVPQWYHFLFVLVNLALAAMVLRRPRWFIPVFVLYMVQQYVEHLPRLIDLWREQHRFDWAGFAALVFVPFVFALLLRDARTRRLAAQTHVATA